MAVGPDNHELLQELRALHASLLRQWRGLTGRMALTVALLVALGAVPWLSLSRATKSLREATQESQHILGSVARRQTEDLAMSRMGQQDLKLQSQRLDALALTVRLIERRLDERREGRKFAE